MATDTTPGEIDADVGELPPRKRRPSQRIPRIPIAQPDGAPKSVAPPTEPPIRLEYLRIENYRILKRFELKNLTPMTVLLGPNGSGKSTVFDALAFLAESFECGLSHAWHRRGGARELKTRGSTGPVVFELRYREPDMPIVTYHLAIDELKGVPVVLEEWMHWRRGKGTRAFRFLEFVGGRGRVSAGMEPDEASPSRTESLRLADQIAVSAYSPFRDYPRVGALWDYVRRWFIARLDLNDHQFARADAGPQERLSPNGDNIANVLQFLAEEYPERLEYLFKVVRRRIPRLERVLTHTAADGRVQLLIKDAPFQEPVPVRLASQGTLKMLAYIVMLYDADPHTLVGIEQPENFIHPRQLRDLAAECRTASGWGQLLVSTHSPFFVDTLRAEEVRVLFRDDRGFTDTLAATAFHGVAERVAEGASLGQLWLEGLFGLGDPKPRGGR